MAPNCQPEEVCQCHSTGGRRIRAWWCRAELTSGAGPPAGQLVPGAVQSKAHQRSWAAPNKTGAQAQRQLRHRQTQTRTTQPGQVQRLRAASNKTVHLKDGRHYPQPPSPDQQVPNNSTSGRLPGAGAGTGHAPTSNAGPADKTNSNNKHSEQPRTQENSRDTHQEHAEHQQSNHKNGQTDRRTRVPWVQAPAHRSPACF